MRDLCLERVLESFHRHFCISLEHSEVDPILQSFIRWFDQKTHHEAVRAHLATCVAVSCTGVQANDHDEGGHEPDRGHTTNTWHRSLLSFGFQPLVGLLALDV
jgi:hypothetical protein